MVHVQRKLSTPISPLKSSQNVSLLLGANVQQVDAKPVVLVGLARLVRCLVQEATIVTPFLLQVHAGRICRDLSSGAFMSDDMPAGSCRFSCIPEGPAGVHSKADAPCL